MLDLLKKIEKEKVDDDTPKRVVGTTVTLEDGRVVKLHRGKFVIRLTFLDGKRVIFRFARSNDTYINALKNVLTGDLAKYMASIITGDYHVYIVDATMAGLQREMLSDDVVFMTKELYGRGHGVPDFKVYRDNATGETFMRSEVIEQYGSDVAISRLLTANKLTIIPTIPSIAAPDNALLIQWAYLYRGIAFPSYESFRQVMQKMGVGVNLSELKPSGSFTHQDVRYEYVNPHHCISKRTGYPENVICDKNTRNTYTFVRYEIGKTRRKQYMAVRETDRHGVVLQRMYRTPSIPDTSEAIKLLCGKPD